MKSTSRTRSFDLPVRIADLFPLFSPEGEKLWVPGWDYENLMGTIELTEDYIFLTKTHSHGKTDAIWIVKRYDPASHFVQYYKIEPGEKIGVVTVKCTELAAQKTAVQVTYKYTALSVAGETFVAEFSESAYEGFIAEWQRLLLKYFQDSY